MLKNSIEHTNWFWAEQKNRKKEKFNGENEKTKINPKKKTFEIIKMS